MNIRNHCKERYCERILNIPKDEIKFYIVQNDERITNDIHKLFEYAKFLWKGQINDNITRNFYIKDYTIIVLDVNNDTVFTIYKVDFDFPEETNKRVVKDLLAEIERLNEKHNECTEQSRELIDKKLVEKENTLKEIQSLEEQIKILKQRQTFIDMEVKQLNAEPFMYLKEIEKYAVYLCNSLGYKLDTINNLQQKAK